MAGRSPVHRQIIEPWAQQLRLGWTATSIPQAIACCLQREPDDG
jgi:hypothetical protein